MSKSSANAKTNRRRNNPLVLPLDNESKDFIAKAAELRKMSISAYVREVVVSQARADLLAAKEEAINLAPADQRAFWKALHAPIKSTKAQKQPGAAIRGKH